MDFCDYLANTLLEEVLIPSPSYFMDLVVAKSSPATTSTEDSPLLSSARSLWDVEDEPPMTVINPALITKSPVAPESTGDASDDALQAPEPLADYPQSPLDFISLGSYQVISIPMKKMCRGRRVPTVEMVQKRVVKQIDYAERKSGRDAFAERRFVCGYVECRKCFKRREHLVRHQRSAHSSEKREYLLFELRAMDVDDNFSFQVPC